jgi:RNA polymerase sigma-70 factor, ECF subfamily
VAKPYCDIEAEIPRLRRFARALTHDVVAADDLVQDCLTRALGKLHLWEEGTDLRAWLFTILHNQHVNHIRRKVREGRAVELSEREPLLSHVAQQGKRLELRDLERAIGRLPDAQRSVILLIGLEGMRYEEVAVVLKIPVGTIRSRLSRARASLRKLTDSLPDTEVTGTRLHASGPVGRHFATGTTTRTSASPWSQRRNRHAASRSCTSTASNREGRPGAVTAGPG